MVARSVEASSCFEMAEMATPEVVITPVMLCDYLERLKTSAFSIPRDRNTIATRLVNEIQALAKTEHGEAVSNFCTELNSALVQIAESIRRFQLESKGYGGSFTSQMTKFKTDMDEVCQLSAD